MKKPKRYPIAIRVPTPLLAKIHEYAASEGITRSEAIRRLIRKGKQLQQQQQQRPQEETA